MEWVQPYINDGDTFVIQRVEKIPMCAVLAHRSRPALHAVPQCDSNAMTAVNCFCQTRSTLGEFIKLLLNGELKFHRQVITPGCL